MEERKPPPQDRTSRGDANSNENNNDHDVEEQRLANPMMKTPHGSLIDLNSTTVRSDIGNDKFVGVLKTWVPHLLLQRNRNHDASLSIQPDDAYTKSFAQMVRQEFQRIGGRFYRGCPTTTSTTLGTSATAFHLENPDEVDLVTYQTLCALMAEGASTTATTTATTKNTAAAMSRKRESSDTPFSSPPSKFQCRPDTIVPEKPPEPETRSITAHVHDNPPLRKPLSPFEFFTKKHNLDGTEWLRGPLLAKWHALKPSERAVYEQQAYQDRRRFKHEQQVVYGKELPDTVRKRQQQSSQQQTGQQVFHQQAEQQEPQERQQRTRQVRRHLDTERRREYRRDPPVQGTVRVNDVFGWDRTYPELQTRITHAQSTVKSLYSQILERHGRPGTTPLERAIHFVHAVRGLWENLLLKHGDEIVKSTHITLMDTDRVFSWLERMLAKQQEFVKTGKAHVLDLGFHYTAESNLPSILDHGLLPRKYQDAQGIQSRHNGSAFGDGIYTSDSPRDSLGGRYGSIGLVVLRLKGEETSARNRRHATSVNSIVRRRLVLLREPDQVATVLQFNASSLSRTAMTPVADALTDFVACLYELVDVTLNAPTKQTRLETFLSQLSTNTAIIGPTPMPRHVGTHLKSPPPASRSAVAGAALDPDHASTSGSAHDAASIAAKVFYEMPTQIQIQATLDPSTYRMVDAESNCDRTECVICWDDLTTCSQKCVLTACQHKFHLDCICQAALRRTQCPICRTPLARKTPTGQMPSGVMSVRRHAQMSCAGFPEGAFIINYRLSSGTQQVFHPNPGQLFSSSPSRTAYVPDTPDGRQLLWRLQESFRHGLTFLVGSSLTTGRSNVVTWASIPHKTRRSGGAHGFPDPEYMRNCNEAMDNLHVKKAPVDVVFESDINPPGHGSFATTSVGATTPSTVPATAASAATALMQLRLGVKKR